MALKYIKVELDTSHWESAIKRAENLKIFTNSHRKKEANEVGCLGEVVLEEFFRKHCIKYKDDRDKTTHDYLINNLYTLDVKTKDRTVFPKKHFDNSVPLYNHDHQRPDYYYFVSLKRDTSNESKKIDRFTHACLLGFMDLQSLEKFGHHWKKGETDPSNGTQFWTDCLNVKMQDLYDNKNMIKVFKGEEL
tara:strand:+ start:1034 stop:1606 length:573 start_codon:yes stop_codon:yes gene_type:complete